MPKRLEGKRIVVTGASRGLGRDFAVALAEDSVFVAQNLGRTTPTLKTLIIDKPWQGLLIIMT